MFNLMETVNAAVQTAVIVEPTVYAVTTLTGKFGAQGRLQLAVGVVLGMALGAGGQVAQIGVPVDFPGWFALAIFALIAGLVPAGVYEANKAAATKGAKLASQPAYGGEEFSLGRGGQDAETPR